jgi:phosphotransferase system enzyme I (PtsI)
MIPMISTLDEVWRSLKIIQECKAELKKDKIKFDNHIKIGIMIEVPSAAVMAKEYAEEIDFISIGTNDLIQYLMAVDRGNDLVTNLYQEFSPVVVRTIYHIVEAAKNSKIPISICGEMAADTLAIPLLVGLGLDSLSMSTTTILYAKRIIRDFEFKKAKALAEECLQCKTEIEIQKKVKKFFDDNSITRTRNII